MTACSAMMALVAPSRSSSVATDSGPATSRSAGRGVPGPARKCGMKGCWHRLAGHVISSPRASKLAGLVKPWAVRRRTWSRLFVPSMRPLEARSVWCQLRISSDHAMKVSTVMLLCLWPFAYSWGLRVAGTGWGHYVTRMPRASKLVGLVNPWALRRSTWSRLLVLIWRAGRCGGSELGFHVGDMSLTARGCGCGAGDRGVGRGVLGVGGCRL